VRLAGAKVQKNHRFLLNKPDGSGKPGTRNERGLETNSRASFKKWMLDLLFYPP